MKHLDQFAGAWLTERRAAFDRETERLRWEAMYLFAVAICWSVASGAFGRLFL